MHRFDTEDYKLNVTTRYSPELIEQEVHNSRETLAKNVIHLQEEGVKEALTKIGYLPPKEGDNRITEEQKLEIQQAHAAFISVGDGTYLIYKDVFNHLSQGSYISNQMLNCYKSIVPDSARVLIYEGEGDGV